MICYKCQKEYKVYVKVKVGMVTTTFCQACYIVRQ